MSALTDFEVEDVVGADCLAAILKKLFDVHGNGQALQLAAALRELAHPGGGVPCGPHDWPVLSVYCLMTCVTLLFFFYFKN